MDVASIMTSKTGHGSGNDGEDSEIEIDPKGPEISKALDSDGRIYRKVGEVRATRAHAPAAVETVLADGSKESKNTAAPGDYIVTAPGGERYVVKADVFPARYELKPHTTDVFIARGHVVAIPNPRGRPIFIHAPWGEIQHGSADCMIADIFNPDTRRRAGRPYLISRAEFEKTYRRVRPPWYMR
jgi:hypothetical protein